MLSFKRFILEVEDITYVSRSSRLGMGRYLSKSIRNLERTFGDKKISKLSKLSNGADVYIVRVASNEKLYAVTLPNTNTISLIVNTSIGRGSEAIEGAASIPGNPTKLHILYHHLITKFDKILTTKGQTPGSQKVWEKLARMPNIGIHGWHRGKAINIDRLLRDKEEVYLTQKEFKKAQKELFADPAVTYTTANKEEQNLLNIYNMILVAHRKNI